MKTQECRSSYYIRKSKFFEAQIIIDDIRPDMGVLRSGSTLCVLSFVCYFPETKRQLYSMSYGV